MVLGSNSHEQMKQGGDHGEDVGYMPFPITVNGKRYATTGSDYCFGVNVKSNEDNKKAAAIFIKWMTEKSGYSPMKAAGFRLMRVIPIIRKFINHSLIIMWNLSRMRHRLTGKKICLTC